MARSQLTLSNSNVQSMSSDDIRWECDKLGITFDQWLKEENARAAAAFAEIKD